MKTSVRTTLSSTKIGKLSVYAKQVRKPFVLYPLIALVIIGGALGVHALMAQGTSLATTNTASTTYVKPAIATAQQKQDSASQTADVTATSPTSSAKAGTATSSTSAAKSSTGTQSADFSLSGTNISFVPNDPGAVATITAKSLGNYTESFAPNGAGVGAVSFSTASSGYVSSQTFTIRPVSSASQGTYQIAVTGSPSDTSHYSSVSHMITVTILPAYQFSFSIQQGSATCSNVPIAITRLNNHHGALYVQAFYTDNYGGSTSVTQYAPLNGSQTNFDAQTPPDFRTYLSSTGTYIAHISIVDDYGNAVSHTATINCN